MSEEYQNRHFIAVGYFLSRYGERVDERTGELRSLPPVELEVQNWDQAYDAFFLKLGNGRDLDELTSSLFHEGQATWKCKGGSTVVIGTASSLRPRKRIEDFILLIKEILDSGHNVHGIIAGGGKYADPEYVVMLEKLILEL